MKLLVTQRSVSTLLEKHRLLDAWFPFRYSLNTHSGCLGSCLYCPVNFRQPAGDGATLVKEISLKKNIASLLQHDLHVLSKQLQRLKEQSLKPLKAAYSMHRLIGIGGGYNDFLDPSLPENMPLEVLATIIKNTHRPFILTKWPRRLLAYHASLLALTAKLHKENTHHNNTHNLKQGYTKAEQRLPLVLVSFSTTNNKLSKQIEATTPSSDDRLSAIAALREKGYTVAAILSPLLGMAATTSAKDFADAGCDFVLFAGMHGSLKPALLEILQLPKLPDHLNAALPDSKQLSLKAMQLFYAELQSQKLRIFMPRSIFQSMLSMKDSLAVLFAQLYYKNLYTQDPRQNKNLADSAFRLAAYRLSLMSELEFASRLERHSFQEIKGFSSKISRIIELAALQADFSPFDKVS